MANILDKIYEKVKLAPQRVAFPEGDNEKIMQAAFECATEGYILPILVGVSLTDALLLFSLMPCLQNRKAPSFP